MNTFINLLRALIISFTPIGNITATNVQNAIEQVISGDIVFGNSQKINTVFTINSANNSVRGVSLQTAGVQRWFTGSDTISDFGISYFDASGNLVDSPISIPKQGSVIISRNLNINGNTYIAAGYDLFVGRSIFANGSTLAIGANNLGQTVNLVVNGAAGNIRQFRFDTNSLSRWAFRCNNTAESGGNAGSNLGIAAFDDNGNLIDNAVNITRAAGGSVTIPRPVSIAGIVNLTAGVASTSSTTGTLLIEGTGGLGIGGNIYSGGNISGTSIYASDKLRAGTTQAADNFTNVQLGINCSFTTRVGIVIRGNSGQGVDLQQWWNNSNTVLASISSTGVIFGSQLTTTRQSFTPTGTTQTINWNNGSYATLDLSSATGNVTLTLQNPGIGTYTIEVIQGGTGRNIIFPTGTLQAGGGGNTYVGAANKRDIITARWNGSVYLINAAAALGYA